MQQTQLKRVSVIVPVYNAEAHLHYSVASILKQTYKNIELILINDGSADDSGRLCENYAEKDTRVKVIHQANAGPSAARNAGLEAATGTYIQFADSDDFLEPEMTEKLVRAMRSDTQLVICGYKDVLWNGSDIICLKSSSFKKAGTYRKFELLPWFGELFKDYYIHFNWNKLYDAALIRDMGIVFDQEIIRGEDLLFNLNYLDRCHGINILPEALYNYSHSNDQSITSIFRPNLFENQQMLLAEVRSFLCRNQVYSGQNKESIENFYLMRIEACFSNLFHPNSTLSARSIKKYMEEIIFDKQVNESVLYLQRCDFEKKLLGKLIRSRAIDVLYGYYYGKSLLKRRMQAFNVAPRKWV
ncbi:glycosyltransferase family 2 protein [Planococcus lenghuensis]|uniref:Glycosyltransferase 2-like domain-containing protein n=1 Tax=Planococcus lenghuensis TaxID=2213202 RepID=A0A1Q2KW72_9BACL|nr:glycosyltransferase [Planococcus lenghuensis]AQQ52393.1 hypothetical protein B0X71_04195 [Planococcus lenghuensis]